MHTVATKEDPDINQPAIDYVANFVPNETGKKFNPHVTIGLATEDYLKTMLDEKVRVVHVFAGGSGRLPSRQLRHSPH